MSNEISSFWQSRNNLNMFNYFDLSKRRNFVRHCCRNRQHCCQKRQQCRSNIRFCQTNRSTYSIRQCCFDIVASMDGALDNIFAMPATSCTVRDHRIFKEFVDRSIIFNELTLRVDGNIVIYWTRDEFQTAGVVRLLEGFNLLGHYVIYTIRSAAMSTVGNICVTSLFG